jgi:hypothetical protein
MVDWMRRGKGNKYKEIKKPSANVLYSAVMDAVDVADRHLTDINVKIQTRKWYFNVFCMILSAAVVEMHSCYTEEHGEETFSRDEAVRRLINECHRAKWVAPYKECTTLPTAAPATDYSSPSPINRKRRSPGQSPQQIHVSSTNLPHTVETLRNLHPCDFCTKTLGKSSNSRSKNAATRTYRFCIDCDMYLCKLCSKNFKKHAEASRLRTKIALETASKGKKVRQNKTSAAV